MEWSLDELYKGFDDPAYAADVENLRSIAGELKTAVQDAAQLPEVERLEFLIDKMERFTAAWEKPAVYASLRQQKNTQDRDACTQCDVVDTIDADAMGALSDIRRAIAGVSDISACIEQSETLGRYRYLLECICRDNAYMLPGTEEDLAARMNLSGARAWSRLADALMSTVRVKLNDGEVSLPEVRNLAYSDDAQTRKDAYEAELAAYPQIELPTAYALAGIKKQAAMLAERRGYASLLDRTLQNARMSAKTLDAMWSGIQKKIPALWDYLSAKGKLLGHENGLPWYDLFAPVGKMDKEFDLDTCREYLVSDFEKFTPHMSRMMDRAFNERWIDMYPAPGKVGGAFCETVGWLKQSRVLTNYNGTFDAVVTLAHELGHSFHAMHIAENEILNRDYSMQLAETASTFNELYLMNHALSETEDKQQRLFILESILMGNTQVICDIYSRFLFESEVVERCRNEQLPHEELREIMLRAQRTAYGTGLDANTLHPYMWACKCHYYMAGLDFYNFPYAFGALFSIGLYRKYLQEGDAFVPKYERMLRDTALMDTEDVAASIGIDITQEQFWEESMDMLADYAKEFIRLSQEVNG